MHYSSALMCPNAGAVYPARSELDDGAAEIDS